MNLPPPFYNFIIHSSPGSYKIRSTNACWDCWAFRQQRMLTICETTIAKLQQLSEPLLQEVTDFIHFVIHKHQVKIADSQPDETLVGKWSQWFETVDSLDVSPPEAVNNYQQLLLNKYRQQGLEHGR